MRGFSLGVRLLPAVYSSLPGTSLILCVKIGRGDLGRKCPGVLLPAVEQGACGPFYLRSVSQSVSWPICCSQGLFLDLCISVLHLRDEERCKMMHVSTNCRSAGEALFQVRVVGRQSRPL
jgi:hypothetical protein